MAENKDHPRGSERWQVLFPTILTAVLLLILGIWLGATAGSGSLSRFAEISTVLLAISVLLINLLIGLVLVRLISLVGKLIEGVHSLAKRVLDFSDRVQDIVRRGSRSLARLVIEPAAILGIFQRNADRQGQEIKIKD